MALTELLILRKPRSGCLEGRTMLIQPFAKSVTRSKAGFRRAGTIVVPMDPRFPWDNHENGHRSHPSG
jgi:hypothetical protein